MFREWKCGCIVLLFQGKVRTCQIHAPEKSTGDGGGFNGLKGGGIKFYPANGEMVANWSSR